MELPEEGRLKLTTGVVCAVIALQDLVDTFEDKRPELSKGPVVESEVAGMRRIMMIRPEDATTVYLVGTLTVSKTSAEV